MKRIARCWMEVFLATMLLGVALPAWSQRRQPMRPQPPPPLTGEMSRPSQPTLNRKILQASYEQLRKDVERLFELAAGLKEEVGKENEDVLSLSGIKKAEEIEKLAKKIQGRMKNL